MKNVFIYILYTKGNIIVYYSLHVKLYEMDSLLLSRNYSAVWTLSKFVIGFRFEVEAEGENWPFLETQASLDSRYRAFPSAVFAK